MMSALTRLIARGKGTVEPRLSPRIASRFETPVEEWGASTEGPNEVSTAALAPADTPAPEVQQQTSSRITPAPSPVRKELPAPAAPPAERRVPQALMPTRPVSASATSETPVIPSGSASDETAPTQTRPLPEPVLVPADPRIERERGSEDRGAEEAPSERLEVRPPPKPLLPPETKSGSTAEGFFQLGGVPVPPAAHSGSGKMAVQQAQEPPEIVIHIGRIDVRSDPAPQATPQRRRQPRAQMTALGDYLKSRGGAG